MNTVFEVAAWGLSKIDLETAIEEAFREVERLEQQLSFYRVDSDIRDLNVNAGHRPIPVDPRLFTLLQRARALNEETDGTFDITVGPLMRAWGLAGGEGRVPSGEELSAALEVTGMDLIDLDPENYTVLFEREGVMIDLGAIGKGYAIDEAVEILREVEVPGAILHAGTSSVYAIGAQPDGSPWNVAIQHPIDPDGTLAVVPLRDNSLSVSAVHGKFFTEGEVRYGHVMDPRLGKPVQGALLAAVVCGSAAEGDALSTALLTEGPSLLQRIANREENAAALVSYPDEASGTLKTDHVGI